MRGQKELAVEYVAHPQQDSTLLRTLAKRVVLPLSKYKETRSSGQGLGQVSSLLGDCLFGVLPSFRSSIMGRLSDTGKARCNELY